MRGAAGHRGCSRARRGGRRGGAHRAGAGRVRRRVRRGGRARARRAPGSACASTRAPRSAPGARRLRSARGRASSPTPSRQNARGGGAGGASPDGRRCPRWSCASPAIWSTASPPGAGCRTARRPRVHAALVADGGELREEAIRIVGERELREEVPTCSSCWATDDETVRDAALGALIAMRDRRAVSELTQTRSLRDRREMRKIIEAISILGGPGGGRVPELRRRDARRRRDPGRGRRRPRPPAAPPGGRSAAAQRDDGDGPRTSDPSARAAVGGLGRAEAWLRGVWRASAANIDDVVFSSYCSNIEMCRPPI